MRRNRPTIPALGDDHSTAQRPPLASISDRDFDSGAGLLLWLHLAAAAFAAAMFLLLIYFHVQQILGISILYDDAWIATAAKNLALGPGYASSYPEIVRFDPNITTGPPVVLVAAALIRVFGNQYWVPNLAIALCVLLVFAILGWLVWRRFGALAFSLALALVALRLTFPPAGETGLLGEIPAAGMAAIGALLIARVGPRQLFNCAAAGLAVGLAIQTKFISALVLPVFAGVLLAARVSRLSETEASLHKGRWWRYLGGFGVGVLLPFIVWNLWMLVASRSWSAWLETKRSFADVFFETAALSRFDSLSGGANPLDQVAATFTRNSAALVEHAGGALWALLFAGAVAVAVFGLIKTRGSASGLTYDIGPSVILGGAALVHGLWWLLFSPNDWLRFLFPGILYMVIALALVIGAGMRRAPRIFAVAVVLLVASWYPQIRAVQWDFGREPRLSALLATRDSLHAVISRDDRALLLACGYWVAWDLEYLLPEAGNFRDCLRLDPQEKRDRRLLLVRNDFYNFEQSVQLEAFRAACERTVLFAREPFVVSECPGLWPLTFPWAESEPRRLREDHPFAFFHLPDGGTATLAHSTSVLAIDTGPAGSILVEFGLVDGAWQVGETDGVEFRISIMDAGGTHLLWSRMLEPRSRSEDRGHQAATVPVPATFQGGQVLAETLPGPQGDASWDWAYWSKITVR